MVQLNKKSIIRLLVFYEYPNQSTAKGDLDHLLHSIDFLFIRVKSNSYLQF